MTAVALPEGWSPEPEVSDLGSHREELWTGPGGALLVQRLDAADPAADLRGWAEAPVRLAGAPAAALVVTTTPQTVSWSLEPAEAAGADEAYAGIAVVEDGTTRLEVHTRLLRRGSTAWHASLALVPGDDARPAAILASLTLG